jgi:hypothetical protein
MYAELRKGPPVARVNLAHVWPRQRAR